MHLLGIGRAAHFTSSRDWRIRCAALDLGRQRVPVSTPRSSKAWTTSGSNCVPALRRSPPRRPRRTFLLVRALVDEDVEHVGDRHEAAGERDLLARQAVRVARRRPSARGGSGDALGGLEQRRRPSSRIRAPTAAWVLTTSNSSAVSRSGLSRIESGIAILPRSCSGAACADQLDLGVVEPEPPAEARRHRADALGVLPGVVVAVLGRQREPAQRVAWRVDGAAVAGDRVRGRAPPRGRARGARRRWRSSGSASRSRISVVARGARRAARAARRRRRSAARRRCPAGPGARAARRRSPAARGSRPGWAAAPRGAASSASIDELDGGGAELGQPRAQARRRARRRARRPAPRRPSGRRPAGAIVRACVAVCGVCHARHDAGPAARPPPGDVVAGYRIESRIGRGGMGVVYLAEHQTLRRRAALKIIAPELAENPDFRERFLREARIAADAHPPERRHGLRRRRGRRPAVHRDAVRPRPRPLADPARGAPPRALPRARHRPPGRRRARRRARARPDPPRRQARQRPDRRPPRLPDRLRPDQGPRLGHRRRPDARRARSSAPRTTSRRSRSRGARSTAAPTSTRSAACSSTA